MKTIFTWHFRKAGCRIGDKMFTSIIEFFRKLFGHESQEVDNTMIMSNTNVGSKFRDLWPNLRMHQDIRVADGDYYIPTKQRLNEVLAEAKKIIDEIGNEFLPEIYDCDDFALLLNAVVKAVWVRFAKENNISKENWKALAFAEVWGTKFRGRKMAHAINGCLTRDDGVVLIEPQGYSTWIADKSLDKVFFVKL